MAPSRSRRSSSATGSCSKRKSKKADGFDFTGFLSALNDSKEKTNDEVLAKNSLEHSKSYTHHQCKTIRSFLQTLLSKGQSFPILCCTSLKNLLTYDFLFSCQVQSGKSCLQLSRCRTRPVERRMLSSFLRFFLVLWMPKKALCNAAMVDWQLNVRKQKVPLGGCPFYLPASTNTNI